MKEIQISKGYVTQVDDADFEWLSSFKWFANVNKKGYVSVIRHKSEKYPFNYMGRMILNITDPKIFVDHKDRNPLNNQRSNLRTCNRSQNNYNTTSAKNSSSKYLGVTWGKDRNKWMARIVKDYKSIYLGYYKKEEDAALAYNIKAIELHGEFANLNQI